MSEFIEKTSSEIRNIQIIGDHLSFLARAFSNTGNQAMAEELHLLGEDLHRSSKSIRDAISEDINASLKRSQEAVGETLSLVLNHAMSIDSKPLIK